MRSDGHRPCRFPGMEQIGHRVGDAESLGGRHLFDAVGVQIGIEQILEVFPGGLPAQNLLDQFNQLVVFPIEEDCCKPWFHKSRPITN